MNRNQMFDQTLQYFEYWEIQFELILGNYLDASFYSNFDLLQSNLWKISLWYFRDFHRVTSMHLPSFTLPFKVSFSALCASNWIYEFSKCLTYHSAANFLHEIFCKIVINYERQSIFQNMLSLGGDFWGKCRRHENI